MIGHVSIGASIYHLLSYVLEDKRELSEEKKLALSAGDHLQHSERAEVLNTTNVLETNMNSPSSLKM
jgi:hypothetical protein